MNTAFWKMWSLARHFGLKLLKEKKTHISLTDYGDGLLKVTRSEVFDSTYARYNHLAQPLEPTSSWPPHSHFARSSSFGKASYYAAELILKLRRKYGWHSLSNWKMVSEFSIAWPIPNTEDANGPLEGLRKGQGRQNIKSWPVAPVYHSILLSIFILIISLHCISLSTVFAVNQAILYLRQ